MKNDYICKVCLDRGNDRPEYVTSILIRDIMRDNAACAAIQEVKRRPWLKLSDIEKQKLIVTDIKTY